MRSHVLPAIFLSTCLTGLLWSQLQTSPAALDSDRDGISDQAEQELLQQFAPEFMIARNDCAALPAEFQPGVSTPVVAAENGTVYGQVFPVQSAGTSASRVEIHFYHLWSRDCGSHPHPLDAEHVSVLVQGTSDAKWKALYWYAGAHEGTVCDQSQVGRASAVDAEDHGARVWISAGKHASYLKQTACGKGCGADRCGNATALRKARIINLGEPGLPMNGSLFVPSALWQLRGKMAASNFPASVVSRVDSLPAGEIALFNDGRHPAQGVIAISSSTEDALLGSGRSTTSAVSVAGDSTAGALQTSYRHTVDALGTSFRNTANGLRRAVRSR